MSGGQVGELSLSEEKKFIHEVSGCVAGISILLETTSASVGESLGPNSDEFRSLKLIEKLLGNLGETLKSRKAVLGEGKSSAA